MTRTLLDNEQWEFGTNCFVCEPKNEKGIGIPFYLDAEAACVVTDFTPAVHHSGAPALAHGGLSMALLDEGMAWAVIAIAHRFGLSRKTAVEFTRPVKVGRAHSLVCRVESRVERDLIATGEILDDRGRVCVSARGSFSVMTKEEAAAALGAQSEQAASYTEG